MALSIVHSAASPFFFGAFRAMPETGNLLVPVQMAPFTSAVEPRELKPETAQAFTHTLSIAIPEIARSFAPGGVFTELSGGWHALQSGPRFLRVENHGLGTALLFDRGSFLTEKLMRHRQGVCMGVRRYGRASSAEMDQAIDLRHKERSHRRRYEIAFESYGLVSLKAFLGVDPDLTVRETGLALFRFLGLEGLQETEFTDIPGYPSLESEIAGRAGDTAAYVQTRLDPTMAMSGQIHEIVTLDVFPTKPDAPALPENFRPLWSLSERLVDESRTDEKNVKDSLAAYDETTRRIYGVLPTVLRPEDVN